MVVVLFGHYVDDMKHIPNTIKQFKPLLTCKIDFKQIWSFAALHVIDKQHQQTMALRNLNPSEFSSENLKQTIWLSSTFWCTGIWSCSSWNKIVPLSRIINAVLGCWWSGDPVSQGISRHALVLVLADYLCVNNIDLIHESLNASVPSPSMHHFVEEMCTCVHISVTNGAL